VHTASPKQTTQSFFPIFRSIRVFIWRNRAPRVRLAQAGS
jgi:hypothetical protein